MPVVNTQGELIGIVSLDDLLPVVAQELADWRDFHRPDEAANTLSPLRLLVWPEDGG